MSWEYTVWILALNLYWSQSCARFSAFISAGFEEIFSIINNILCFFQFYFWVGGLNFGMQLNICLSEYTVWILALSLYWSQSCARFSAFISAVFEEIFSIINNILCFFQFYFWVGGLNFGMQLNVCLENIQCEF